MGSTTDKEPITIESSTEDRQHWRSYHNAFTHVRNRNCNIQGGPPDVVISGFPYHTELLLKERIRFLWEQILSFKRISHFGKEVNLRESLLDPVGPL